MRRRVLVVLALVLALLALPVGAGTAKAAKVQPTVTIAPGETVVLVADSGGPYDLLNIGHHTCGHGCTWEIIELASCPGALQTVEVTNVSTAAVEAKSYFKRWTDRKILERNTGLSRLAFETGCTTPT